MKNRFFVTVFIAAVLTTPVIACGQNSTHRDSVFASTGNPGLTQATASAFAHLALECIHKEYPNKLSHVMNDESEVLNPETLHPAFFGCFDWHSSVHGHWMLVRILRVFPDLPDAAGIRRALDENLTAGHIESEVGYLEQPSRKSFERTYGWAWLLKLSAELHDWDDADGKRWATNLAPLARAIAERYVDFLPRQTYPIRTGVHPNTAFGIAFAFDYAETVQDTTLRGVLIERSRTYFGGDTDYPAEWEPGGDDFFSPCLIEADLMRRIMDPEEFTRWFHHFLPGFVRGEPPSLLRPAIVADRTDPKIVHLDGLNLSRTWCMLGIASALPGNDSARPILIDSALRHAEDALAHVASGNYEGEHWLASFAVYTLSAFDDLK